MRSNKLLLVSEDFNLERGGVQNTSFLLAEYLSKDVDVVSFCQAHGDCPIIPGLQCVKSRFNKQLFYLFSILELIALHKKEHFNYALATNYYDGTCLFLLSLFCGVPYGILTHGNEVVLNTGTNGLQKLRLLFLPSVLKRYLVLKRATNIYSNTEFTASFVRKIVPSADVYVIHPPISMKSQTLETICTGKHGYLLSVGRLVERKGYQIVLQALSQVVGTLPEIKYIIVGKGEYENELKKQVSQLGLDSFVIFKGHVSDEEKCRLIKDCGLFVMPSFYIPKEGSVEGFGISFIEANSYGKFVVGTISGGIPEAIKDRETGFLIRERDANDLRDAIINFYGKDFSYNPQKCLDWAAEHHILNIAKKYLEIITKNCK